MHNFWRDCGARIGTGRKASLCGRFQGVAKKNNAISRGMALIELTDAWSS